MSDLRAQLQQVFNEPDCATNQAKPARERKKGCSQLLAPGAAAGGCAFDGAKIALQPITDVVHLVHGPIACEGNSWDGRGSKSSTSQLYRTSFTTDMTHQDIVFGGEKHLYKAIKEAVEKYNPAAVFVYQTCVPAMIGDDVEAVCKAADSKLGKPVIPVNVPGFVGSKNLGNKLAGEALLDYVIGTEEPEETTPYDINIIGEYNLSGELWQVKPLLDELGIRILACISGDAKYHEVARSHRARAAMMVCSKAMINVARKMEERFGIPFFEGSFYGIGDMSDSLRRIAQLLVDRGAPTELLDRTELVIEREEARALHRRRQVLVSGGGLAGGRSRPDRDQREEVDAGGQGTYQGADEGRCAHVRRPEAARDVQDAEGGQGGHHAIGRPDAVCCAQGEDAVARHQPGTASCLRRIRRHGGPSERDR